MSDDFEPDDFLLLDVPAPLYIFDLDGTLSNMDHRMHLLEPKTDAAHDEFTRLSADDKPYPKVITVLNNLLHGGAEIWIFTGRRSEVREETVKWLIQHTDLTYTELETGLIMREAGSREPDLQMKRRWYEQMLDCDKERLVAVFDDRQRVVDMWRSLSLTCLQVRAAAY